MKTFVRNILLFKIAFWSGLDDITLTCVLDDITCICRNRLAHGSDRFI